MNQEIAPKLFLADILPIEKPSDYKAHFARWNNVVEPLEVFARDKNEWRGWNEYRPLRNDFNRAHIFSLIYDYRSQNSWLFGGIWDVIERHQDRYEIDLSSVGSALIGRLKIEYAYLQRATRVNFENHYSSMVVREILSEPFSGRAFPGFEEIDVSFDELETIVRNSRTDWRSALESVKGIYLITDRSTGKRYVGSASGENGIWGRWCAYVHSGHGGNVELKQLVSDPTLDYCRANFRFALLEHRSLKTDDMIVLARENFWKGLLLSRGHFGLNRN